MLLDVRSLMSVQKKKKKSCHGFLLLCWLWNGWLKALFTFSAALILLREKQRVPRRIRRCFLPHKCQQFSMISNQKCRVKHAPVSWLGTRPLLTLKVSFLKSLEVWILLTEVSAPSTILSPHPPEVPACIGTERKYHSSALLESVDGDGEMNRQKGRLTGRKATAFIWNLFVLFDSKYFIEKSNYPKDTDEPGVLYCRKAGLEAQPPARNWGRL